MRSIEIHGGNKILQIILNTVPNSPVSVEEAGGSNYFVEADELGFIDFITSEKDTIIIRLEEDDAPLLPKIEVGKIVLKIHNVKGQLVFDTLVHSLSEAEEFKWNGKDNYGKKVGRSIYFLSYLDVKKKIQR